MVSGTIGAGKSSAAAALRHLLSERGHLVADIDLDALCQLSPGRAEDPYNSTLGFANLAAVWPNYARLGTEYLVIARVVEDSADRARYAQALPDCPIRIVRVDASAQTRVRRIRAREIEPASRDWHLARSDVLAETLAANGAEDLVVVNDRREIADVAEEILARLVWTAAGAGGR